MHNPQIVPTTTGLNRVQFAARRDPPVAARPGQRPRRNGGLLGYRLPEDFLVAKRL